MAYFSYALARQGQFQALVKPEYVLIWAVILVTVVLLRSLLATCDVSATAKDVACWLVRIAFAYAMALETVSVMGLFSFPGFGLGIWGVWIAMMPDRVWSAWCFTRSDLSPINGCV